MKFSLPLIALLASVAPAFAGDIPTSVKVKDLASGKHTTAGLYLSSKDAHQAMQTDSKIILMDVRTRAEVTFVGTPPKSYNVPLAKFSGEPIFNPEWGTYQMSPNPKFAVAAKNVIARAGGNKDSKIFLICRSGGRSAVAANQLYKLGYKSVYSVVDGFEGNRKTNGWKTNGLPMTFKLDKDHVYQPPK